MRKSTVKHDANARIVRDEPKKTYELLTAVFEVRNAREYEGGKTPDEPQTLCVMRYVRLDGGVSHSEVLNVLADGISKRYHVGLADVMFRFWCDSYTANGGSPMVFVPEGKGGLKAKLL